MTLTDTNNWFADTIRLAKNADLQAKLAEAIGIAKQADVVVFFVGGNASMNREGWAGFHPYDRNLLRGNPFRDLAGGPLAESGFLGRSAPR